MPSSISNGVTTHYPVAGEGPPLVLLHAMPFDHTLWLYQISRFSAWYKVIALDVRAHGRTESVVQPYVMADLVEDVVAVCRRENAAGAILAGISVGSRIALQLVLDHPRLFKAVVLVGSGARPSAGVERRIADYAGLAGDAAGFADYRRRHLEFGVSKGFPETPLGRYLIDGFAERSPRMRGDAIAALFRAFGHVDLTDRLGEIALPTLIVNGEFDNALESGRWTAARIRGAIHRMLPGAGHACNLEKPAEFDRLTIEFLEVNGLMPG